MEEAVTGALLACYLNRKDLHRRENPEGRRTWTLFGFQLNLWLSSSELLGTSASPEAPPFCSLVCTVGVSVQWGCPWVLTYH